MSFVLLAFTGESVATTFMVTAGMFGALAVYGTVTQRSLAGWGQFLFMGLIGVVIASFVGMFWHNDALQFVLVVHRRHRVHGPDGLRRAAAEGDGARAARTARPAPTPIVGALTLYLDFINLFLMLLRFTGSRRD